MTEQEAKQLKIGSVVFFIDKGRYNLTYGKQYQVGGSSHGMRLSSMFGLIIGIEKDDNNNETICCSDEITTTYNVTSACGGKCDPNCPGICYDKDSSDRCDKKDTWPYKNCDKEPECKCLNPTNHDKDCAWNKWWQEKKMKG